MKCHKILGLDNPAKMQRLFTMKNTRSVKVTPPYSSGAKTGPSFKPFMVRSLNLTALFTGGLMCQHHCEAGQPG